MQQKRQARTSHDLCLSVFQHALVAVRGNITGKYTALQCEHTISACLSRRVVAASSSLAFVGAFPFVWGWVACIAWLNDLLCQLFLSKQLYI